MHEKKLLIKTVLSALLFLAFPVGTKAQVDEIGPRNLTMNMEGNTLRIPYFANRRVDSTDLAVKKVVIVIHGMNRNAGDYYRNMKEAAKMSSQYTDSLLIVAPQFLEEEDLDPNHLNSTYLYWSSGWKSGSNSKNNSNHPRPARISSYAVMDTLMMLLADHLPNLKFIVIAGHSAGGQLANRYSASSPVPSLLCKKNKISTRFVVANPSSYLYLDNQRVIQGTVDQFGVPDNGCSGYNDWRYGLENLYVYPDRLGADSIRQMFKRRNVVYLLGGNDTDPNSSSLDKSCKAELEGSYRLERGAVYYNYLKHYYGNEITQTQKTDTVPGVGHDNLLMFSSAKGRYWLFMSDPPPCLNGGATSVLTHPDKKIKIYPNPANDFIHIQFGNNIDNACYSIYNATGRILVKQQPLNGNKCVIDLKNLKPGMYLLIIRNKQESFRKIFFKTQ